MGGDGEEGAAALVPGFRRVQKKAEREGGWTRAKKDLFLETLRATCNISAALREVGMSRGGLEKLRARDGAFRAGMNAARREAYRELEYFALEKMMSGVVKTVTKADGKVETVHEYPLHLALQLLRLHGDVASGGGGAGGTGGDAEDPEAEPSEEQRLEVVDRLMRKLRKLRERMDREEAAAAAEAAAGGGGAGEGAAL
ncbi:MAG TPA: hypothetical protein VGB70_00930 [Allosphingosinicella sp.]|jgi:hypothetical protein